MANSEMTNEEAIRQLESLADHCRTMQDEPGDIWEDDIKALDKAIKALKREECKDLQEVCRSCSLCFVDFEEAKNEN